MRSCVGMQMGVLRSHPHSFAGHVVSPGNPFLGQSRSHSFPDGLGFKQGDQKQC